MLKKLVLGSVLLISVTIVKGDVDSIEIPSLDGVSLGDVSLAGTGCPAGSVFTTLDGATGDLLVLLDDFIVEAGGSTRIARKNCALAIPVQLPPGLKVALVSTRFEGFNYLTEGASSVLSSESFLAGSVGELTTDRFDGAIDSDFVVEKDNIVGTASSDCGGSAIVRINSSLRVRTQRFDDYALAGLTAMGASARPIIQHLRFTACTP